MALSHSIFKPSIVNYKADGTGRDTYAYLNDQWLGQQIDNPNGNWKVAASNFYTDHGTGMSANKVIYSSPNPQY